MLGKAGTSKLVAHKEDMLLIDSVYSYDGRHMEAGALLDGDNPFCRDGRTPGYVAFELMAQAIAAFSFLAEYNGNPEPDIGFILKVSSMKIFRSFFSTDERLSISIDISCALDNGIFKFDGSVKAGEELAAEASLLAMSVPDPVAVLKGINYE